MNSKDWKVAMLVSVATLMLTACGDDKKGGSQEPVSPYVGSYLAEEAYTTYHLAEGDTPSFCRSVSRKPEVHGIFKDSDQYYVRVNGITVRYNGEVFRFTGVNRDADDPEFRRRYLVGEVREDGWFTASNRRASSAYFNQSMPHVGQFYAEGDTLTIMHEGRNVNYVRVDEKEMLAYLRDLNKCVDKWERRSQVEPLRNDPPRDGFDRDFDRENGFVTRDEYEGPR